MIRTDTLKKFSEWHSLWPPKRHLTALCLNYWQIGDSGNNTCLPYGGCCKSQLTMGSVTEEWGMGTINSYKVLSLWCEWLMENGGLGGNSWVYLAAASWQIANKAFLIYLILPVWWLVPNGLCRRQRGRSKKLSQIQDTDRMKAGTSEVSTEDEVYPFKLYLEYRCRGHIGEVNVK